MDYKPTIWVKILPDWKLPCECRGKRSGTKDGTTVWCKSCQQNWKISKYGVTNDPSKPSPQTPGSPTTQQNGWQVVAEVLQEVRESQKRIEAKLNEEIFPQQ